MVLDKCHFGIFFAKRNNLVKKGNDLFAKRNGPMKKETILMENNLNNNNNLQYTKTYQKSKERNDKIGIQKTRN